jgi:hypothetical protein
MTGYQLYSAFGGNCLPMGGPVTDPIVEAAPTLCDVGEYYCSSAKHVIPENDSFEQFICNTNYSTDSNQPGSTYIEDDTCTDPAKELTVDSCFGDNCNGPSGGLGILIL